LRTAESGYLTRKLCDSSQEVIVRNHDCHSDEHIVVDRHSVEAHNITLEDVLYGRVLAADVVDDNGVVIAKSQELIDRDAVELILDSGVDYFKLRSPLTCHVVSGVCQQCYGFDLSKRAMVEIGNPAGIIAAQSIGEPATQLTLNTFHGG
jgi:DNA-directed RNA polymerase subunit beta'